MFYLTILPIREEINAEEIPAEKKIEILAKGSNSLSSIPQFDLIFSSFNRKSRQ